MAQQFRFNMLRLTNRLFVVCVFVFTAYTSAHAQIQSTPTKYTSLRDLLQAFKSPPAEFRSTPLWVWNDRMTKEEIDVQLKDFKDHGIGGVFIHPRPGLVTPYLSDEWLSLCKYTVEVGKKLGMKIWIYDENSYPSGFAGGHVPAQMPDAVRKGLRMSQVKELPQQFATQPVVVLKKDSTGFVDITSQVGTGSFGIGDYYVFDLIKQKPSQWYGGFTYVDLMQHGVTEKFIDITMNACKRAFGEEFGKVVPGVFQDEAEINPATEAGSVVVNYTPAMFDRFRELFGYDLNVNLPSLYDDVGNSKKVRHDFYATLLDLFVGNWAKPYYDYCSKNDLIFTGHYWEHEWPHPVVNPDNLACFAYQHMPGIDILMNDFQLDSHAQFGNARSVKEIRSSANQLGRSRTLSETFGAGGWDMTFFDQKRIADWEYALGVNFMDQHLSYVTIKGARKRDHPQSFSYHEPWWGFYKLLADYYGRLSVALSSGRQDNRIVVIEPTTTAWMYFAARWSLQKTEPIGKRFQDFVNRLEAAQIEYDLASEHTIREFGKSDTGKFVVGVQSYDLVILPPGMENLDKRTVDLLEQYLARDGKVLCYGNPPAYVEGTLSHRVETLAQKFFQNWITVPDERDLSAIRQNCPPRIEVSTKPSSSATANLLFHHRRVFDDFELLFLVNTNSTENSSGTIRAAGKSCEQWSLFDGSVSAYPAVGDGNNIRMAFDIPPGGSLMLCIRQTETSAKLVPKYGWNSTASSGATSIRRAQDNVLTLDYCDLTLDGATEKDLYFYQAQLKTFQHHGLERNPWDNGVQYKTSILDKNNFPPNSGFEAAFHFTVADGVKKKTMKAVVENPELFQVSINGRLLKPLKNRWWLDKAFGVFDIGENVQSGENVVTVKSSPFTIFTELEPIYILGDFAVEGASKGFRIVDSRPLNFGSWVDQGMPFYAHGVKYAKQCQISTAELKSKRFAVQLGRWSGTIAKVNVNGKSVGEIAFAPFELDVTRFLKSGKNDIVVTVYGSLKNTLGPHHNNPQLGRAWPGSFQQGEKDGYPPGSKYSLVGYGLLDDFVVKSGTAK